MQYLAKGKANKSSVMEIDICRTLKHIIYTRKIARYQGIRWRIPETSTNHLMVLKHLNRISEGQKHQQGTAIYMLEVLKTQFDSYYYSHSMLDHSSLLLHSSEDSSTVIISWN
jgi:hypothetical protein